MSMSMSMWSGYIDKILIIIIININMCYAFNSTYPHIGWWYRFYFAKHFRYVVWLHSFVTFVLIGWLILSRIHYPIDGNLPGGNDHCYQLNHVGQTWQEAMETCRGSMLHLQSLDELNFLRTQVLQPQSEISPIWLAGKKLMQGVTDSYLSTSLYFMAHCT